MYKKIAAGVMALALTMSSFAFTNGVTSSTGFSAITASAATTTEDLKVCGDFSYRILEDGTAEVAKYSGTAENLVIPSALDGIKVTSLGKTAFSNNKSMKNLTIPNTVTKIGNLAFSFCKMESVSIPNSVKIIDNGAFYYCGNIKNLTIPNSVEYIGSGAFEGLGYLKTVTIPSSVKYIGSQAFSLCYALESATIPSTVEYVGSDVFMSTNYYKSLPDGPLYFGKSLTGYKGTVPENSTIDFKDGTIYITSGAFRNAKCTTINLPKSLKGIENNAFSGSLITSINIPEGVETIGERAFASCKNLTEAVIPDSVTSMEGFAFGGCSSLTKVKIGKNIKKIGVRTFQQCTSLTDVELPEGLETIDEYAFYKTTALKNIKLPSTVKTLGRNLFEESAIESIVIPDGVEEISRNMFYRATALKSITIPDSVKTFGTSVFYKHDADLVINCTAGSAAEEYAKTNSIKYNTIQVPTVKNLSDCTAELSAAKFTFTGGEIKPSVTVKDGDTVLKEGTDYTVAYKNNAKVGTGSVVITGNGNYEGTVTKTFTILPKSLKYCKVALKSSTLTYNGLAQKPAVQVKIGDKAVYSGNYTVTYKNNVNAGTATVTLTGKGSLQGTVTKTFKITPKSMKYCTVQLKATSYKYTGSAIKPAVRVKIGSTVISSDNYTVAYKNNTNKGTAAVKITGKGSLQGYVVKSFTIK